MARTTPASSSAATLTLACATTRASDVACCCNAACSAGVSGTPACAACVAACVTAWVTCAPKLPNAVKTSLFPACGDQLAVAEQAELGQIVLYLLRNGNGERAD